MIKNEEDESSENLNFNFYKNFPSVNFFYSYFSPIPMVILLNLMKFLFVTKKTPKNCFSSTYTPCIASHFASVVSQASAMGVAVADLKELKYFFDIYLCYSWSWLWMKNKKKEKIMLNLIYLFFVFFLFLFLFMRKRNKENSLTTAFFVIWLFKPEAIHIYDRSITQRNSRVKHNNIVCTYLKSKVNPKRNLVEFWQDCYKMKVLHYGRSKSV